MFDGCPLINKLFSCDNELDRFDVLAIAALNAPEFPQDMKTDENRVKSCQTKTWFYIEGGKVPTYHAESNSLFIKGLCIALIEAALNSEKPQNKIGFADECYARGIINADRREGLSEIENKILNYININNINQGEHK